MFDAVQGIRYGYILCGIIWAVALGFAVGNYACSLVHRLPRGRLILDQKPYCGSCGTQLHEVWDLIPVVSALMLHHRCRYCGEPFPVSHTWTELLVGLLFALTFLAHGFGQEFLLIAGLGVFLIVLAAIQANEGIIMGKIVLCITVFGMLYRTLADHTIFNFFEGGFIALAIGAILWHRQIKPVGHIYTIPEPVKLLTVGGICAGQSGLPMFFLLFLTFYGMDQRFRRLGRSTKSPLITVAFGFAVMLPLLYPKLVLPL